jgi:hypothetical protein
MTHFLQRFILHLVLIQGASIISQSLRWYLNAWWRIIKGVLDRIILILHYWSSSSCWLAMANASLRNWSKENCMPEDNKKSKNKRHWNELLIALESNKFSRIKYRKKDTFSWTPAFPFVWELVSTRLITAAQCVTLLLTPHIFLTMIFLFQKRSKSLIRIVGSMITELCRTSTGPPSIQRPACTTWWSPPWSRFRRSLGPFASSQYHIRHVNINHEYSSSNTQKLGLWSRNCGQCSSVLWKTLNPISLFRFAVQFWVDFKVNEVQCSSQINSAALL